MSKLSRTVPWVILLAAWFGLAGTALAACTGPEAMVAKLRAHPTTDNAVLLGSWYASHHQFACAAEVFANALKRDPQSAELHYLDGLALEAGGDSQQALPAIREAIRLQPQVIKPHLVLATLLDQSGKHDEAEEQWRLALGIDHESIPALEGLSDDLLAHEDFAGVIVLLRSAPRTEKLAINLSQALGKLNYLDDALKVLTEAMEKAPESIDLAKAMTVVLVNMHRYDQAIDLVQATADKHPDNVDAQVELFRILVLTNHFDRALPMAPRLLAVRPHDYQVLYLCGMVARATGKDDQARDLLEKSVAVNPNFFYSHYYLGIVLVVLHEWKEADENLEKAIELNVPTPEVHFELAKALKGLGENERAMQEMKLYQQMKQADGKRPGSIHFRCAGRQGSRGWQAGVRRRTLSRGVAGRAEKRKLHVQALDCPS